MKYVIATKPDSNGISEVFHSVVMPADAVPAGLINRWNSIVEASPMKVLTISGKENLAIGSVWNEDSETFTMTDDVLQETTKPVNNVVHVFLVNNVVTGMFGSSSHSSMASAKYMAAFADPVSVFALEDDSPVDLGYTYDGTSFSAPVNA